VSHETIYLSLFVQPRGALRRELTRYLRTGRAMRFPRGARTGGGRGQLRDTVSIRERPAEAEDRAMPGHWAGDLVFGRGMSAVGTLVERTTRYLALFPVPAGYKAPAMREALAAAVARVPAQLRRSLTWDQGKEMADHVRFTVDTGLQVYFFHEKVCCVKADVAAGRACLASSAQFFHSHSWSAAPCGRPVHAGVRRSGAAGCDAASGRG